MRGGMSREEIIPGGSSSLLVSVREKSDSLPTTDSARKALEEMSRAETARPLVRLETMECLIKQFRGVAGTSGYLCERDFKKAADIRSDFFANRLFRAIDLDNNGCITCDEFVNFMYDLQCQNELGRIRGLFNLYDFDGSGGLSYGELVQLLTASVEESNSQMEAELIEHIAECLLKTFDADGDGEISFEEFVALVSKHPQLLSGLTVVGLGSDNSPKGLGFLTKAQDAISQGINVVVNNPQRTFWVLALAAGLAMMFWWRAGRYSSGYKCKLMSWTLPIAKGCGQMLKLITTLILLPVSRRTTTVLRETPLRHIIPFDDAISFHILLGTLGFIFAWVHALCHVHDFLRWGDPNRNTQFKKAFPEEDNQPSHYELWTSLLGITGVVQLMTYTLVFLTASNWPRRAPWLVNTRVGKRLNDFRLIWYVHHLTAVYIGSLLVHGVPHIPNESREWAYSDVWAWVGIPVLLYIMERIGRLYRQSKPVRLLSAELLPGKVIALKMSKPRGFNYDCGMYVYVNCPKVSHYEWHPFSLTSAPGAKHLSLHIRVVGDWTEELYNRFREYGKTLRHEEFGLSQKMNVLPNLETMSQGVHLKVIKLEDEAARLVPTKTSPQGPRSDKGKLSLFRKQPTGKQEQSMPATSSPPLLEQDEILDSHQGNLSMRSFCSTHPETPPARMPTPRTDLFEAVQVETAGVAAPKYVTPAEEVLLTKMAPSPLLSHLPRHRTSGRGAPAVSTPFAAFSGGNKAENHSQVHSSIKMTAEREGSAGPSRLLHRSSFLLEFAHVQDAINEEEGVNERGSSLPVQLLLDGPFGAPAQGYRDYPVLLLVGAGIGVTPFASVLSDLVQRMSSLSKGDEQAGLQGMPHLKKVYFHWSIRSQSEVIWFSRVLEAITREDSTGLLDVNVHITGLRSAKDVRTMPLKLVQVAVHSHTGVDVMSGLRCRVLTRFGRPDWSKTFRNLQELHRREKIGVFYSGPNTLGSVLRRLSHKYSKRGSKFHFVKETFGYW